LTINVGDKVLLFPDGRGGYTAYEISAPAVGEKCILLPDGKGGYIAVGTGAPSVGDKVPVVPDGKGGYLTWRPTIEPTMELSYGWSCLFVHGGSLYAGLTVGGYPKIREYTSDTYTDYTIGFFGEALINYKIVGDVVYFLTTGIAGNQNPRINVFNLSTKANGWNHLYVATDYVDYVMGCPYTEPPRYFHSGSFKGHFGYDGTNFYVTTAKHVDHYPGGETNSTYKIPISTLGTSGETILYIDGNYGHAGLDNDLISFQDCHGTPPYFNYPVAGGLAAESRDIAYIDGSLYVEAYNHSTGDWELMEPSTYTYLDDWDTICTMPGARPDFNSGGNEVPYTGDMYVFNDELYALSTDTLYKFNGSSFSSVCSIPWGFEPVTFQTIDDELYLCGYGGAYKLSGSTLQLIGNPANEDELVTSLAKLNSVYIYGLVKQSDWQSYPWRGTVFGRLYPTTI